MEIFETEYRRSYKRTGLKGAFNVFFYCNGNSPTSSYKLIFMSHHKPSRAYHEFIWCSSLLRSSEWIDTIFLVRTLERVLRTVYMDTYPIQCKPPDNLHISYYQPESVSKYMSIYWQLSRVCTIQLYQYSKSIHFWIKEVVLIINIARSLRESLWLFLVLFYWVSQLYMFAFNPLHVLLWHLLPNVLQTLNID